MATTQSPKAPYHVDWVVATGANVHYAQDRSWFTTYTPFPTSVGDHLGTTITAQGVGEVVLELANPDPEVQDSHTTITLHDVLYMPRAPCNLIAPCRLQGWQWEFGRHDTKIFDHTGQAIGVMEHTVLWKVRLYGQEPHTTSLDKNRAYCLSVIWSEAEERRWLKYSKEQASAASKQGTGKEAGPMSQSGAGPPSEIHTGVPNPGTAPYIEEEKDWLKQHYGGEFKFLRVHGLNIYKEEDREEGRAIARGMVQQDG